MAAVEFGDLLPAGFSVGRVVDEDRPWLVGHWGPEGSTYPDGRPFPELTVKVRVDDPHWPEPEVSWETTSDTRPELARALAVALSMAVDEVAERMAADEVEVHAADGDSDGAS